MAILTRLNPEARAIWQAENQLRQERVKKGLPPERTVLLKFQDRVQGIVKQDKVLNSTKILSGSVAILLIASLIAINVVTVAAPLVLAAVVIVVWGAATLISGLAYQKNRDNPGKHLIISMYFFLVGLTGGTALAFGGSKFDEWYAARRHGIVPPAGYLNELMDFHFAFGKYSEYDKHEILLDPGWHNALRALDFVRTQMRFELSRRINEPVKLPPERNPFLKQNAQ